MSDSSFSSFMKGVNQTISANMKYLQSGAVSSASTPSSATSQSTSTTPSGTTISSSDQMSQMMQMMQMMMMEMMLKMMGQNATGTMPLSTLNQVQANGTSTSTPSSSHGTFASWLENQITQNVQKSANSNPEPAPAQTDTSSSL